MLQRLKIGARITLVAAVASLTIVGIVAFGALGSQRTSLGSSKSDQVTTYNDLLSATEAPSQSLLRPYLVAHQLVRSTDPTQTAEMVSELTAMAQQFEADRLAWNERLAGIDVDDDGLNIAESFAEGTGGPVTGFWLGLTNEFLPAIEVGDVVSAGRILDGSMAAAVDAQNSEFAQLSTQARSERTALVDASKSDQTRNTLLVGVLALIAIAAIAYVARLVARSLRESVEVMTRAAHKTAEFELTQLVEIINTSPVDAPPPITSKIAVDGDHEMSALARSIEAIRDRALELATDQKAMRQSVSETFLDLGRRNQALVNRQLSFIDQLERGEQNPDTLEDLFRLDHLATRMRRNAESLLVLAGADQARRWTVDVDVAEVVRSALSEIEEYTQVEMHSMDRVNVRGSVAADLAHLLAELLENATAFSPPTSPVTIAGRMFDEGYVLSIVDEGIGVDADALHEMNDRLNSPASFDRASSKVLGLFVVGRLAERHGVRVKLVDSPTRGLTARVLLPLSAIERPGEGQTPVQAIAAATDTDLDRAMTAVGESLAAPQLDPGAPTEIAEAPATPAASEVEAAEPSDRPSYRPRPERASAPLPSRSRAVTAEPEPVAAVVPDLQPTPQPPPQAETPAPPELQAPPQLRTLEVPDGYRSAEPAGVATNSASTMVDDSPQPVAPLARRVRGAQLPDTGPGPSAEVHDAPRSADDVRALLNRFRSGVDRGRDDAANEVDQ